MKRLLNRGLSALVAAVVVFCSCIAVGAESVYRYGDWTLTAVSAADGYAFGLRSYEGGESVVTVPDNYGGYPIVAVNGYAFSANTTLREITLSDQIASVGNGAFLSAANLEKVTLTSSVLSVGESAFAYTPALKEINLFDSSIESVSKNAFISSGIEAVALPDTCTAIGDSAFARCGELDTIIIPDSITVISSSAFRESPHVVIYAAADSYAIAYAKENQIEYVYTGAADLILGDVNGDRTVNISDVAELQQYLAELIKADRNALLKADANQNGTVDISDATAIQMYLAEYDVPYPIGNFI